MRIEKIKGSILTAHPENMDYETYRFARKEQEKQIKRRLQRGFVVWPREKGTLVGRVPQLEFV